MKVKIERKQKTINRGDLIILDSKTVLMVCVDSYKSFRVVDLSTGEIYPFSASSTGVVDMVRSNFTFSHLYLHRVTDENTELNILGVK